MRLTSVTNGAMEVRDWIALVQAVILSGAGIYTSAGSPAGEPAVHLVRQGPEDGDPAEV